MTDNLLENEYTLMIRDTIEEPLGNIGTGWINNRIMARSIGAALWEVDKYDGGLDTINWEVCNHGNLFVGRSTSGRGYKLCASRTAKLTEAQKDIKAALQLFETVQQAITAGMNKQGILAQVPFHAKDLVASMYDSITSN
jgi:hypothetical protein